MPSDAKNSFSASRSCDTSSARGGGNTGTRSASHRADSTEHVLELERHDVGRLRQFVERLEVVELAANVRAHLRRARLRRGVEDGAADAERIARQGDHPPELPAAENADTHGELTVVAHARLRARGSTITIP